MLPGPWDASQWELPQITFLQMLWLMFHLERIYMNEWMHSWRNIYFIDLVTIFIMIQDRAQNSLFSKTMYSFSALLIKKTFFHPNMRLWDLCWRSVDHTSMIPFLEPSTLFHFSIFMSSPNCISSSLSIFSINVISSISRKWLLPHTCSKNTRNHFNVGQSHLFCSCLYWVTRFIIWKSWIIHSK